MSFSCITVARISGYWKFNPSVHLQFFSFVWMLASSLGSASADNVRWRAVGNRKSRLIKRLYSND